MPIIVGPRRANYGHTLSEWQKRVQDLLRVTGEKDFTTTFITDIGIGPAIVEYSTVRSRQVVAEVAGAGSPYLALPEGWVEGFSSLLAVEYPARENPPSFLDSQSWQFVGDPADVSLTRILLNRSPTAAQHVRLTFTSTWPVPTDDAGIDKIGDVGFEACCNLAASLCCVAMIGQFARSTYTVEPTDRGSPDLEVAAKAYRDTYERLLGLSGADSKKDGSGGRAPAYGSYDYDPAHQSLFHGGRR